MANQGSIRLKVTNDAPAIEKLWNGRFRLEFLCDNNSPKTDWYSENISSILPDYGILQDTNFGSGVSEDWEAIPASVYPDMRLVETEYVYIPSMGDKRVKLTYETLTASWVAEKDEDTDYELNGLKRVLRTFVALPDTAYDKVVGTSTIDSNGTTLYLGSFKIEETDAKWSLSEVWLEAGELSRDENSEDAKGSISITQIGGCPTAPAGYTVVNESKNNTQGFETCSRTFYRDDSELSRSNDHVGSQLAETIEVFSPTVAPTPTNGTAVLGNKSTSNVDGIPTIRYTFLVPSILSESSDKVGSQLAITVEAFNETPATPAGYVLANTQASDVEGIVTNRYTFLKPSILSQSEDKVGSQLAITIEAFEETPATPVDYIIANTRVSDVEGIPTTRYTFLKPSILSKSSDKIGSQLAITIEAFGETPATPTGYVLANEQVSDFEGISTKRFTFLEPSILSLAQEFAGGKTTVVVEAFAKTEAEVDTAIAAITSNHLLVSQVESDFEGIKTTKFNYEIDAIEIVSSPSSSLLSIQETELSINNLTRGVIGSSTKSYEGKTLYLGEETIDNNNAIKTRTRVWLEAGILSETEPAVGQDFLRQKSITWQGVQGSDPSGFTFAGKTVQNVNGFQTITAQYYNSDDVSGVSSFTYQTTQAFTIPGTVTTSVSSPGGGFSNRMLVVTPPVSTLCKGTVTVSYSTNGNVALPANFYQQKGGVNVRIEGIGYFYRPFASTSSYSNHVKKSNGASSSSMIQGNPLYARTFGSISISGTADDPAGQTKTVSIKSTPVFRLDGTQYFKHEQVELDIPSRTV